MDYAWAISPLHDAAAIFDRRRNEIKWLRYEGKVGRVRTVQLWMALKSSEQDHVAIACTSKHLLFCFQQSNGSAFYSALAWLIPWEHAEDPNSTEWKVADLLSSSAAQGGIWSSTRVDRAFWSPFHHALWSTYQRAPVFVGSVRNGKHVSGLHTYPIYNSFVRTINVPSFESLTGTGIVTFEQKENGARVACIHSSMGAMDSNLTVVQNGRWMATLEEGSKEVNLWRDKNSLFPKVGSRLDWHRRVQLEEDEELLGIFGVGEEWMPSSAGFPKANIIVKNQAGAYLVKVSPWETTHSQDSRNMFMGDQWFGNLRLNKGFAYGNTMENTFSIGTKQWRFKSSAKIILAQESWFGEPFVGFESFHCDLPDVFECAFEKVTEYSPLFERIV